MIKFLTPKIKLLKKLNIPFLLNLSSKYNYKLKYYQHYKSYYELKLHFIRYICYYYCITYKQYIFYKKKINSIYNYNLFFKLINYLELRLDIFLVNIGCFKTIPQVRHYLKYKYIYVNNNCNIYYNKLINIKDIIFFNNKIKYIILQNLIFKYNMYIYIINLYKYNIIQIYSYNNFYILCTYNLKIKILYKPMLNDIWYIYNILYYI